MTKLTQEEKETAAAQKAADKRAELEQKGTYVSPTRTDEPPVFEEEAEDLAARLALETFGDDLTDESRAILQDELDNGGMNPITKAPIGKPEWKPKESVITLRGDNSQYLPARRRVQWMRQEPTPHPDWTIEVNLVEHAPGVWESNTGGGPRGRMAKITGGRAVVRATLRDELGRVIAQGSAQEYSEIFPDYVEKAETSAIARCLAIAGYGTEAALDFDEGFDDGNIADSPVHPVITGSDVQGVRQGGRQTQATEAQLDKIRTEAARLELTPEALVLIIGAAAGTAPELEEGGDVRDHQRTILDFLAELSFDECGRVVRALLNIQPE